MNTEKGKETTNGMKKYSRASTFTEGKTRMNLIKPTKIRKTRTLFINNSKNRRNKIKHQSY